MIAVFYVDKEKNDEKRPNSSYIQENALPLQLISNINRTNMKNRLTATFMLLCSIATMAQTTITTYRPGVSTEGAAYYLPKTAINVSITTEQTTYTPGELCQYADRYLRITGISDKADTYHTILSATLSTEGLPDDTKLYHILFAPGSVAPLVSLTESGILLGINTTVPDTPAATPKADPAPAPTAKKGVAVRSYMTEEMLMTSSKAKLAELVAKEIYSIRESKNLIMRGQNEHMPKDAEALRLILAGLQEQEEALTQLFTGTTTTETSTQTYQVIPTGSAERVIFGRFSRKLGLLHGDDLAGTPLYIDVKKKQTVPAPGPVAEETKPTKKLKKKDENLQDGLVYNIPGKAEVNVYTNTQILAEELLTLAQFGNTETLSSDLLTRKKGKDTKVLLDPATGALLRVEE